MDEPGHLADRRAAWLLKPVPFGLEQEMATALLDRHGQRMTRAEEHARFFAAVRNGPHLPSERGLMLPTSHNFYEDPSSFGDHVELCTGECIDPAGLVAHAEAGYRLAARFYDEVVAGCDPGARWVMLRASVDYRSRTTWGRHLSIGTAGAPEQLAPGLAAVLAAKVVFAGAGGFSMRDGSFVLSPRVHDFVHGVMPDGQSLRGMVSLRRPLGVACNRLHTMAHEALMSWVAQYLDIGLVVLAARCLDAGLPAPMLLADPGRAARIFARDPQCQVRVPRQGRRAGAVSAVEIIQGVVELAGGHLGSPFMPAWAGSFCDVCTAMLKRLQAGAPESVADCLDWAIKLQQVFRTALPQEEKWAGNMSKLHALDMRFSEERSGIFREFERDGLVDQRMAAGLDEAAVLGAMDNPPTGTRAALRGHEIRRLHAAGGVAQAGWTWIVNDADATELDLSDPFATAASATWRPRSSARIRTHERVGGDVPSLLRSIQASARSHAAATRLNRTAATPYACYEAGDLPAARQALQHVDLGRLEGMAWWMAVEEQVWIAAAMSTDDLGPMRAGLDLMADRNRVPLERLMHSLALTACYTNLAPSALAGGAIPGWLQGRVSAAEAVRLPELCRQDATLAMMVGGLQASRTPADSVRMLVHHALGNGLGRGRVLGRALTFLADAQVRLGAVTEALGILESVEDAQRCAGWRLERGFFTLPAFARAAFAAGDTARARWCLIKAVRACRRCSLVVGEARALLLLARMLHQQRDRGRLAAMAAGYPVLAGDPVLRYIFDHWDDWVGGGGEPPPATAHDPGFWGL